MCSSTIYEGRNGSTNSAEYLLTDCSIITYYKFPRILHAIKHTHMDLDGTNFNPFGKIILKPTVSDNQWQNNVCRCTLIPTPSKRHQPVRLLLMR